jgi:thiamine pyrophosphate-dependent acetolactate synthase large subunit-like protein
MSNLKIYEAVAQAFAAEGVDMHFGLMGDGNMHWMTAMSHLQGMRTVSVRHEHCSVMMAMGYWSATGKVGVASVTHGPGFTQTMTALTTGARNNVPLVIFVGEAPLSAAWYLQAMDHAPLALACGAHYIAAHNASRIFQHVREAFYIAQFERKPVVLGIPLDLQKQPMPNIGEYVPSSALLPPKTPLPPDPKLIDAIAQKLAAAKCPVIVAGRGVIYADGRKEVEELADQSGALLGTSLMGKGLFDHHPYSLGVVGGYARQAARDAGEKADLVIAIGASLGRFTLDGGKMFPKAEVIQIDVNPIGLREGLRAADLYLQADAKLASAALLARWRSIGHAPASVRTPDLAKRIKDEPADSTRYNIPDGTLDPRAVIDELERIIPTDYHFVSGSAHQAYWHTVMRGADPTHYHAVRAFGAIGNALSFAIGVAAARKDGRVVLFEGDGGLLMHIQELETLKRQGIKLLVVCINDGAFGAEIHKLRVEGIDDSGAVFGRPGFEAVAKAFGLAAATVTDLRQFKSLMAEYESSDTAAIWDVHVSDQVMTPPMRDEVAALSKALGKT